MAYGKITPKQQEILDYIKNEILNRGFPPAVREICEAVNLKSTSSVHSHLEALEKNGYIRRVPTKQRAIEIIVTILIWYAEKLSMFPLLVLLQQDSLFLRLRISKDIFRFRQNLCRMNRALC